jgi:hypothetical protein
VQIDASNFEDEVSVRVGKAVGTNDNTITTCAEAGCAAELRALAGLADQVQMCTTDGCDKQSGAAVLDALPPGPSLSPTPDGSVPGTSTVEPEPTRCPRHGRRARLCRLAAAAAASPSPTPSLTPSPTPTPTPGTTPTPTSTPSPSPVATVPPV